MCGSPLQYECVLALQLPALLLVPLHRTICLGSYRFQPDMTYPVYSSLQISHGREMYFVSPVAAATVPRARTRALQPHSKHVQEGEIVSRTPQVMSSLQPVPSGLA